MKSPNKKLAWGSNLLALGYLVAMANAVEALIRRNDPTLHHKMNPGTALVSIALVLVMLMIVLRPLRRGEPWALWAAVTPMLTVGIPRLITDPACQLYDLSHHGCHQFMIGMALAGIGVLLSCLGIFAAGKTSRAAA